MVKKGLVYAIIPARSGSQGVKDKNIRLLAGHPLLAYSIAAAKLTPEISRTIASTDSEEYASIARRYGADVPFLRPAEISGNQATDLEFMLHAISWLEGHEGVLPELWVHLRPTTPLRDSMVISEAIAKMAGDGSADSLRSAHLADVCPFKWFWRSDDGYYQTFNGITLDEANGPRQKFPRMYIPDGYVDVLRTEFIQKNQLLHGRRMIAFETEKTIDVDTEEELDALGQRILTYGGGITRYLERFATEGGRR